MGVVLAGGGSVIAASGGSSSNGSSSKDQYCPPNSPGAGQPQGGPGNNCGNPPENCPNGNPKPPGGNCGKNPSGPGEKKKPKWYARTSPRKGCVRNTFTVKIGVANKPSGAVVRVYRDGRRFTSSRKNGFKVKVNARRLRRGSHRLTFRVRGQDGKSYAKTVRFKRC